MVARTVTTVSTSSQPGQRPFLFGGWGRGGCLSVDTSKRRFLAEANARRREAETSHGVKIILLITTVASIFVSHLV